AALEPKHLDREWLARHLADERRGADLLGEIREAIFGAQDGVTSILIVVITVATATTNSYAVLVAGIAAATAEIISMAAGEYMSSRSQRQLFLAQIERERAEVRDRPGESEAEVAYLLEQEGLSEAAARRIAAEMAREPNVLLKTMVEKELGITVEAGPGALQGALVLVSMFALGVVKARFIGANPLRSGLEIVALVACASAGGYVVGTLLPRALGFAATG